MKKTKKAMKRVIVFSDSVDHDRDCIELFQRTRNVLGDDFDFEETTVPSRLEELIGSGDVVFVDYGGFGSGLGQSLFEETDRQIRKIIEDRPNTNFVFVLTVGKDSYGDDVFELPNVSSIDRCADEDEWERVLK